MQSTCNPFRRFHGVFDGGFVSAVGRRLVGFQDRWFPSCGFLRFPKRFALPHLLLFLFMVRLEPSQSIACVTSS